ncbi:MAG: endonuclease/exonuclease/phosphatase family protein [Pyrinomonadaceae bacterium]
MLTILSWNMAHRSKLWHTLPTSGADVALLQEACEPPHDMTSILDLDDEPWRTEGAKQRRWKTAIVGLNLSAKINRLKPQPLFEVKDGDFGVTRLGTIAAAHVKDPHTSEIYTLVSMYSVWEKPHLSTGSDWIYADSSVHRLISDISSLVGQERGHRIIVAGDLNILYGYGEFGNKYWAARYGTIFNRFKSIGLEFVGPQSPNGRQADPWPVELPTDSLNVPTYYTNRQSPQTATRQLDFVFASTDIAGRVKVKAVNLVEEWGGSDHCRIKIEIG